MLSLLAVVMHKRAECRQTWSYLTRSTIALLICGSQNDPRSKFPLKRRSPRYSRPSEVQPHLQSPTIQRSSKQYESTLLRVFPNEQMNESEHVLLSIC